MLTEAASQCVPVIFVTGNLKISGQNLNFKNSGEGSLKTNVHWQWQRYRQPISQYWRVLFIVTGRRRWVMETISASQRDASPSSNTKAVCQVR